MGKKFAPAFANIYMAEWERFVFPKCPLLLLVSLRYLDDIFGVWPHSVEDFGEFLNILNTHHDYITLKYELKKETLNFLDTEVFFSPPGGRVYGTGNKSVFQTHRHTRTSS